MESTEKQLEKSNSKKSLDQISAQDAQQMLNIVISLSGEFFKVVMACLLAIFVPQSCNGEVCSFSQNFSNLTIYNSFVIAYNFLTLGFFLYLYWVEVSREQWLITHFDYDEKESEYGIKKYKDEYKEMFDKLQNKNKQYMNTYNKLKYLYISNFIFSAVLVLHFFYLDYRTVTTLLTNVILCWSKVMKGYSLAKKSYDEEIAISYYNIINLAFNTLDPEYVKNKKSNGNNNPEIISDKQEVKEVNIQIKHDNDSTDVEVGDIELVESNNKLENI